MTWATRDVNGPITMTAWVFVCDVKGRETETHGVGKATAAVLLCI